MTDIPDMIRFAPALPCQLYRDAWLNTETLCGKPAIAGTLVRLDVGFQLMPVCKECAAKINAVYAPTKEA